MMYLVMVLASTLTPLLEWDAWGVKIVRRSTTCGGIIYYLLGKKAMIMIPMSPRRRPPKNQPTTLRFLNPAIIGQTIMARIVNTMPNTVMTNELSILANSFLC